MKKNSPNTKVFASITAAYFLIAAWAGFYIDPAVGAGEWGDTLAGVFSPLAFLWLLYAALAQRAELELQRQELQQTRDELRRSADAQERSEKVMRDQMTATSRPLIKIVPSEEWHTWVLMVTNEGRSAAINTKLAIDKELPLQERHRDQKIHLLSDVPLFASGGLTIAPGTVLNYRFPQKFEDGESKDEPLPSDFNIEVSYDFAGERFVEIHHVGRTLSIGTATLNMPSNGNDRVTRAMGDLKKSVDQLNSNIATISRTIRR